jgi:hypothetical protein
MDVGTRRVVIQRFGVLDVLLERLGDVGFDGRVDEDHLVDPQGQSRLVCAAVILVKKHYYLQL